MKITMKKQAINKMFNDGCVQPILDGKYVVRGRLNQRQGMLMHCKLYLWRLYFCQIWIFKGT
jgi:hypothetical protein